MSSNAAEGVPTPQRGAQAALEHGWRVLREHPVPLILVAAGFVAVELALGTVGPLLGMAGAGTAVVSLVEIVLSLVISAPVGAALGYACLEASRGTAPELGDLLDGYDHFGAVVLAAAIVGVAVGIGLLLLVLPGIYIGLRLAFAPLLVMDKDLGGWEAVQESGDRTGGQVLSLFALLLATVVILVVGALLLGVGILPAVAWVGTSWAGYYRSLVEEPASGGGGAPAESAAGA